MRVANVSCRFELLSCNHSYVPAEPTFKSVSYPEIVFPSPFLAKRKSFPIQFVVSNMDEIS